MNHDDGRDPWPELTPASLLAGTVELGRGVLRWLDDPSHLRRFHLSVGYLWFPGGLPLAWFIAFFLPPEWAAFVIIGISLYANAGTHWASAGAARTEQALGNTTSDQSTSA